MRESGLGFWVMASPCLRGERGAKATVPMADPRCACCWRRYVLVSRVRTLDSLRLLQDDVDGRQALSRLKHDEYLAAWEKGYDPLTGRWSDELAVAALKDLRRERLSTKQKRVDAKKKTTAVKKKLVAAARKRAPASIPAGPAAPAKRVRGVPTVPPA